MDSFCRIHFSKNMVNTISITTDVFTSMNLTFTYLSYLNGLKQPED